MHPWLPRPASTAVSAQRRFHGSATMTASPSSPSPREVRLLENRALLRHPNMQAFLAAIALAEGGGYDFRYGAVRGRRNDPWRFSDYATHPGPGRGGKVTAAGMYQITRPTWREMGARMGLTDFSPETQDLAAVEILRTIGADADILRGDLAAALDKASRRWSSLPRGKGLPGRYPPQPSIAFDAFASHYRTAGGTLA
jgi:muramidase (phage lysozyme)